MSASNYALLDWYALHVRTNRERSVVSNLTDRGYESYLPLMREQRRYSGRIREVEVPCFPGYIFCRLDPKDRLPVLVVPDVHRLLGTPKEPQSIPDVEIQSVRKLVNSGMSLERCPYMQSGDSVQIGSGPLSGLEGILIRLKNRYRAVVSVSLLRRSVSVEVEAASIGMIKPLNKLEELRLCPPSDASRGHIVW